MSSIKIKNIQARAEGLKIEFDILLGIAFNNDDLNIDQFNLQVRLKLGADSWFPISQRWDSRITNVPPGVSVVYVPYKDTPSTKQPCMPSKLPSWLEEGLGIEQARRLRAVCALFEYCTSSLNTLPRTSHEETINPRDGQERDIRITIPLEIPDYPDGWFLSVDESLDIKKYFDILSLHNFKWDFEAVLASSKTRADDTAFYQRSVQPFVFQGEVMEEVEDEDFLFQLPDNWFGRLA